MKVPTVTITIPLYNYDEEDNIRPLEGEELKAALEFIKSKDDFAGYSIGSMCVMDEEFK